MGNKLKVLLINPNFFANAHWIEKFVGHREYPLGLGYIAASIRQQCEDVSVQILDTNLYDLNVHQTVQFIVAYQADILGFSVYTSKLPFIRDVISQVRKMRPDSFVVLGGPHASALPYDNLDLADVCVVGEAELSFIQLIQHRRLNKPIEFIPGLVTRSSAKKGIMTEVTYITDLNSIPFPARNALASCHGNFKKPDCHSIVTSRGCPFDCAFCANKSIWGTHVRERSLDNVFAELDEIISKDRRSFLLIRDDNFICKEEKLSLFCKRLQNTFPKLKWACHARADALNLTLLKEMERAGCMSIQVGVESGDDQILAKCQKNVTTRQLQKLANDFSKVSIDFWATFILGHLDETEASIRKTISFAQELKPTYVSFLFMIPFPGTTYYDELSTQGRIEFDDWAQWDFCAKGPVYETEYLSKKRLIALKKLAFRRYYLNPFNLVRFVYALFRRWKNAAIKF